MGLPYERDFVDSFMKNINVRATTVIVASEAYNTQFWKLFLLRKLICEFQKVHYTATDRNMIVWRFSCRYAVCMLYALVTSCSLKFLEGSLTVTGPRLENGKCW